MKILLTADPPIPVPPAGYGGIERIVDSLARHYRDLGHEVGLLAHPESTCDAGPLFPWPANGGRASAIRNTIALSLAVGRFKPDLVHSFSRLAYLLPLLPRRLPKVMSYQRHTGGRQITIAAALAGRSLHFTGCSEFICNMARASGGSWDAIHNFVEIDRIKFAPAVPADAPLLFLSRIESIKGPDLAIAVAGASGRRLILAGNKPTGRRELSFWNERIEPHLSGGEVEWVGEVNDAQKSELLGRAAALIVPIQWDEPFGIVFAEALAAGTPVITCARGALPEIVDQGKTGYFINGIEDGRSAVLALGSIDRADCRRAAATRFSRDVCASRYLELYAGMLP